MHRAMRGRPIGLAHWDLMGIAVAVAASCLSTSAWAQKPPAAPAPVSKPAAKAPPAKAAPAAAPKAPAIKALGATSREADEKAIRLVAADFAKHYNAHDAKALAGLFTADAEIVDEAGIATQGKAQIEDSFATIFEDNPDSQIEVNVKSVRFLGPSVAIEDGTTTVVHDPGETPERNRYTVVHTKQDGNWLMASARDLADEPVEEEKLKELAWMIGEWVDESPDALIMTSTHWADNQHFLLSEFTIHVAGRPLMQGTQRIGWDPLAKIIRSWVFDSEGGFAEGAYSHDGDRWIVKLSGVTRDGKVASATNITTVIGKDRFVWESHDRNVGGEAQPDLDPVSVVRKPPKPQ